MPGPNSWLRDVLAAGGGAGFDVFNYHDYKSWWTLPTHYDQFRAILDAIRSRIRTSTGRWPFKLTIPAIPHMLGVSA